MHLVPPLVGFGVLMTNLVEGLMCLWELQDNIGSSPLLIRFTYQRWPLKMCENIEDNGVHEDIHDEDYDMWRHSLEDYGVRRHSSFVVSFASLLSHRNHRTVMWGPSEQSQSDWCDAQPKSYVFERRQWEQILSRVGWVSFTCNPSQAVACVWNLNIGHVAVP